MRCLEIQKEQPFYDGTHLQCHRLEAFDADVKELVEKYQTLPPEAQSNELLLDFETRWKCSKDKLAQRLSRRRV